MYHKLAPQRVQHTEGYFVQVADRTHVEYTEGSRRAVVDVEFAVTVGVYRSTLQIPDATNAEREVVLGRIVGGLEAMGCKVELC